MKTQSNELPKVKRWQDGYEIPVNITSEDVTDDNGSRIIYSYDRLVVPALTIPDVESAVARNFESNATILADAVAITKAALI